MTSRDLEKLLNLARAMAQSESESFRLAALAAMEKQAFALLTKLN